MSVSGSEVGGVQGGLAADWSACGWGGGGVGVGAGSPGRVALVMAASRPVCLWQRQTLPEVLQLGLQLLSLHCQLLSLGHQLLVEEEEGGGGGGGGGHGARRY